MFEKVKGWKQDISKCRKPSDLPKEAFEYVKFIEKLCGAKIAYVSVGAERDEIVKF